MARGAISNAEKMHLGNKARHAAVKVLIENHEDEFAKLLGDQREKLGLPREAAVQKPKSKLEQLREQLREAGIDPKL